MWYKKKPDELYAELNTSAEGLSQAEVESRLAEYGPNALAAEKGKSLGERIAEEFKDPLIIILIFAAAFSAFLGDWIEAVIILAIVAINAALSLYQEGKAEESIKALQDMSTPEASVLRDGKLQLVSSKEIVPGDIVILETGDIVPADMRLIDSSNLKVDESSLTGESVPVDKDYRAEYSGDMEIGDRDNYVHSSTIVAYGRGTGLVTDTGHNTEIGKIATKIQTAEEEETPLQRKLNTLSKQLGIIILAICVIVLAIGVLYKHQLYDMIMMSISLAVAAIPEGLAAIVTIVLSLGMKNMSEKNAIVKKLLAVETLGTTTFICSDKTGTLTQNQMTVTKAYIDGKSLDVSGAGYCPEGMISLDGVELGEEAPSLYTLMSICVLTNDAKLNEEDGLYSILGDPTEGALLAFAGKKDLDQVAHNQEYKRIEEIPFDSARKMMTTFHENFIEDKLISFTKGAPDVILDRCDRVLLDGHVQPLTDEIRKEILEKNSEFALEALRVLGFAFKEHPDLPSDTSSENIETDMVFVGLTGMIDPARPEVRDAIRECKNAGIVPVMITGDYLETAYAIGKDLGIAQSMDQAIMGRELNDLTESELREIVKTKRIFARVSPENKVQIVDALKANGEIVAMTGDGVNDAPALKKADIGVAMGITGTDVAKSTSEVILTDDNFATIVHAVEEGRIIYSNIKKFVSFLLSCNIGEVLVVFIAILLNLPIPLTPIQLLWLNLVTDSFPALALGVEPGQEDIMDLPPRDPDEAILDKNTSIIIAVQSIAIAVATLGAYFYGMNKFGVDTEGSRTMAFATLITAELLRAYSSRSTTYTLAQLGIKSNMSMVYATTASFALMLAVLYIPPVADIFNLVRPELADWGVIIGFGLIPLVIGEIRKLIARSLRKSKA